MAGGGWRVAVSLAFVVTQLVRLVFPAALPPALLVDMQPRRREVLNNSHTPRCQRLPVAGTAICEGGAGCQRQEAGVCSRIAARSETSARVSLYMSGATPRLCWAQDTSFDSSGASDQHQAGSCYSRPFYPGPVVGVGGCMEMPQLGHTERWMGS